MKLKKVVKTEWRCPNCDVVIELPQIGESIETKKIKRKRWTLSDERKIWRLKRSGKTLEEIGKIMGRTSIAICRRLSILKRKMGLPRRECKRWSRAEDDALLDMRGKGKKFNEIGRKLGRSTGATCARYHRIRNW